MTSYIDNATFVKLAIVLMALGYSEPKKDKLSDGTEANGAYITNIANQYPSLSLEQIKSAVKYARSNSLNQVERDSRHGWIDRRTVFGER